MQALTLFNSNTISQNNMFGRYLSTTIIACLPLHSAVSLNMWHETMYAIKLTKLQVRACAIHSCATRVIHLIKYSCEEMFCCKKYVYATSI